MSNRKLAAIVTLFLLSALVLTGRGQQTPPTDTRPRTAPAPAPGESMTGDFNVMLPPPLTKLEAFAAQRGVVIIKGYTDIGTLNGDDSSSVLISAVHFSDGTNKVSGVAVHVSQPADGRAITTTAYVDENELDGLIAAIDSIAKLQEGASPMQQFEARYQTLGALELVNTNVNGGRMIHVRAMEMAPVANQRIVATSQFFVSRLPELGQRLTAAKELLNRAKTQP
ncbi:MAG: hypothetical protein QOE14_1995 [Humisphaera sp.]|nr:hypothetical protein [Humisphaera sp.]